MNNVLNAMEEATHMIFAVKNGRAYACCWDVPAWPKDTKAFCRENAGSEIFRVKAGTKRQKKLLEQMMPHQPTRESDAK
jgi:hypothetical protein